MKMKSIKGYEGIYSINENGEVWSHERIIVAINGKTEYEYKIGNKWLKSWISSKPAYMCITLYKNKKSKHKKIHRLLAQAFIPNPLNRPQINHKNGIKLDNSISNLEWVTHKENVKHAQLNGLYPSGEKANNAKFNLKIANKIRKNHNEIRPYVNKIWENYNISRSHYYKILSGKIWS